jgi:hypothetical protein
MSEIKVNKISPRTACGTTTLGDSGDTFTIPAGVTITNNGTQTGFGRTGTVDWQTTPKTGDFTAANGEGYFVNTTSGAIEMTMPSGSAGSIVSIQDYNKTFDSNALTITPASGQKINGGSADGSLVISTEGQGLTFVYVDSTVGWKTVHENEFTSGGSSFIVATGGTETTSGNDKIHTFTGPGTFTVTGISPCAANNLVSYVVVGGGGGGGNEGGTSIAGAGAGAGGYREVKSPVTPYTASPLDGYPSSPNRVTVTATSYPITVGAGGSAPATTSSSNGSNSIFSSITAAGGGFGASGSNIPGGDNNGGPGGSGGGAISAIGNGNTPPTTPAQGNDGGASPATWPTGGGGGAGAAGADAPSSQSGAGGAGVTSCITASPVTRADGGGGGAVTCRPETSPPGAGGSGGGGAGGSSGKTPGSDGTVNTGGGGGGSGNRYPESGPNYAGGAGGSGIVIIRYKFQ